MIGCSSPLIRIDSINSLTIFSSKDLKRILVGSMSRTSISWTAKAFSSCDKNSTQPDSRIEARCTNICVFASSGRRYSDWSHLSLGCALGTCLLQLTGRDYCPQKLYNDSEGRYGNVLKISPPLVITKELIDFALEVLDDALKEEERKSQSATSMINRVPNALSI
jgi:hypothetical protein